MAYTLIDTSDALARLERALAERRRLALDCEAAGFHRYSDRLCLLQLSTDDETFLIDPLAVDAAPSLRPALEDPGVRVVMHGADFDLRLLARDLDIALQGLFDTQIAAALLGEEGLGLAALLEKYEGVTLSKAFQRADWAERPLSPGMLEYAANDTRYLLSLSERLEERLHERGREAWVEEECRVLVHAARARANLPDEPGDRVTRVKGARDLTPREVTRLREALAWRDELAQARDRAPFRVVGDRPLLDVAVRTPRNVSDLTAIKGFPRGLARDRGQDLLARLRAVAELGDDELTPYPRGLRRGPGRPPPELEELVDRLKGVRNRKADELGIARGTLLANGVLLEIARRRPTSPEALYAVEGMRRWQVDVLGRELLAVLT